MNKNDSINDIAQITASESGRVIIIFHDNTVIETTAIDFLPNGKFELGYIYKS